MWIYDMAKRRIIIREYDLEKCLKDLERQFESVSFTPLKKEYFERRATYFALKGKQYIADQYSYYEYPNNMLGRITNLKLHNRNYSSWLVKFDADDYLTIRAGLRQPESKLGLLTLVEKPAEPKQPKVRKKRGN